MLKEFRGQGEERSENFSTKIENIKKTELENKKKQSQSEMKNTLTQNEEYITENQQRSRAS